MCMVDKCRCLAWLGCLACLLSLPLTSWAQRDPIGLHQRPGRHEHSGDSQTVMQQWYGPGRTYFQGVPAFATTAYGATILPYDLPAGNYTNAANYPLQLSVQPSVRLGGGTESYPCYSAVLTSGSIVLGRAVGVPCTAVASTFSATVPAGAAFQLLGGTAQVTAMTNSASWRESGIVFDAERNLIDGSGCEFSSYTGIRLFEIKDNLNVTRQETEPCPRTVLSPNMPPGINYGTLSHPLQLSIRPILSNVPGECWRLTVVNQTTGQTLMDLRQPTPCGFIDSHDLLIPVHTSFSMSGGQGLVTVLGINDANWTHTDIVFPVTFVRFEYGDCSNFNGVRMRTRFAIYINNRNEPMRLGDTEAC